MTPTQAFVSAIVAAFLTSSAWPVLGPKIVEWKNRKKLEQQKREDDERERHDRLEREDEERREREREQWMRDAAKAYKRVEGECEDCKKELRALKEEHNEELRLIRRELGDVKDALLNRIEALDEILPYITNLPDEKVRELRAANRAHRQAVFRGRL